MTRTTIMLPEDVRRRAMAEARQRRISFAEFVRHAISDKLARPGGERDRLRQRRRDPLFRLLDHQPPLKGRGPTDVAAAHDEYLYGRKSGLKS